MLLAKIIRFIASSRIDERKGFPQKAKDMSLKAGKATKRVAICLEMEWGHKRHLETYAGVHKYADKAGWDCVTIPLSLIHI